MTNRSLAFLLALPLAAAAGCDADDDLARYFAAEPAGDSPCSAADASLAGRREVRLHRHGQVDLLASTRALQRYYGRRGLTFFITEAPEEAGMSYALDTDEEALRQAAAREFPGVDLDDEAALMRDPDLFERVRRFALNFVLSPVIDFARTHRNERPVTHFVLLPGLTRTGSGDALAAGGSPVGLALSPALLRTLASTTTAEATAWKGLAVPTDFSPVMFLDDQLLAEVSARAASLRDRVVAHELGHTAGLPHHDDDRNLMYPTAGPAGQECADLDGAQLATMRQELGLAARAQALVRQTATWQAPPSDRHGPTAHELVRLLRGDRAALARLLDGVMTAL